MKRIITISTFFVIIAILLNQHLLYCQIVFQKTYGTSACEDLSCVEPTNDGGFIGAGQVSYPPSWTPPQTGYLFKTNPNGVLAWTKIYSSTSGFNFNYVLQTSDSGYIITGDIYSFGQGGGDICLTKTDNTGNLLWTKAYGGSANEIGNNVLQTADGGYIVQGRTQSFGAGLNDIYLIRTDSLGNPLWFRTYGGTGEDYCSTLRQTSDGGFILAGSTTSFDSGNNDIYILKIASNGNLLWSKTYGGNNSNGGLDALEISGGGYFVVGSSSSGYKMQLIRIDNNGDTLWTKTYEKPGMTSLVFYSVEQTSDGNYIIAGELQYTPGHYDAYLLKVDTTGNYMWAYAFTSTERFNNVRQTSDNGLILSCIDAGIFGQGCNDAMLIKTDRFGNSNCYQNPDIPIIGNSSPIVLNASTIVDSGGMVTNGIFTVNNRSQIETVVCFADVSAIDEIMSGNYIVIYPNPTSGVFYISSNKYQVSSIEIYNELGEQVYSTTLFNSIIDLSSQSNGVYFIHIISDKGTAVTKVVIDK